MKHQLKIQITYTMKHIPKIILFLLGMPQLILSLGCPDPVGLGPRTDDDNSMCAILYDNANDDTQTSCYGDHLQVRNGEQTGSVAYGWNDRASSLVVRDGCTFTGYKDGGYHGHHQDFTGIHFYLPHEHFDTFYNWNDEISSYICKCWFSPVDCSPEDMWELITSCHNQLVNDSIACTYQQSHGITMGKGFTNGHDVSATISAGVAAEISMEFAKASASISGSLTTGYSWSESEEFSTEMNEGVDVEFSVPAGSHRGVYQIKGECGDSKTRTTCFEVRDMDTKMVVSTTCP
ncbi:unnamed protein product, partial [Meganyctiphanes norvegica]